MKKNEIRVLVVDDEASLVDAMKRLMIIDGYQVRTVTSGKEAIQLIADEKFHIVFLDVNMPDLNGLETYKRMKEISPDTPVIMITGYGRSLRQLIEEARQLGVKACIDKPFKIQQVYEAIQTYVPHEV